MNGTMMLKVSNSNSLYCYKRALAARERALEIKLAEDRKFYFEAEARWLKLAESYEFSEPTQQFIAGRSRPSQRPSCPACATVMSLAEVQVIRGAADYRYQCEACGYNTGITFLDD